MGSEGFLCPEHWSRVLILIPRSLGEMNPKDQRYRPFCCFSLTLYYENFQTYQKGEGKTVTMNPGVPIILAWLPVIPSIPSWQAASQGI